MRRGWWAGLLIGLLAAPSARADVKPVPSHRGPRLDAVTLEIRHRVYHQFRDEQRVKLSRDFIIGDTDYTARIVRYEPDFTMDLNNRRIYSRTNAPNNPAFQIIVRKKNVPQDTTWAFLNMPPHFAQKSLLAFRVLRVDFLDRPSLSADTTKAAAPAPGETKR